MQRDFPMLQILREMAMTAIKATPLTLAGVNERCSARTNEMPPHEDAKCHRKHPADRYLHSLCAQLKHFDCFKSIDSVKWGGGMLYNRDAQTTACLTITPFY
ncbi:hypothetical protein CDAR_607951 [Caerostris darwini]|uniref:Uncharacterized protein n=1 Tax=Caerostris darwini TaxID=1538125 RepID=A0AAV4ULI7_9ARAC|nr:hypothetical protein CDAR_607951 [Caerostris darwini]